MGRVLVVTPVDSSGASGLTAATEAIRAVGADPYPVPSAFTIQGIVNTDVKSFGVPKEYIIEAIRKNEPYDAAFLAVSPVVPEEVGTKCVVDPVFKTSYGAKLFDLEGVKRLIKGAYVITPNYEEAVVITGSKDVESILEELSEYSERVIVKNVNGYDYVRTPHGRIVRISPKTPAVGYRDLRGTGTFYASTIAGLISNGYNPVDAARIAKRLVEMSSALSVYTGSRKTDTLIYLRSEKIKKETRERLIEGIKNVIRLEKLPALMPEVGSNFGFALPRASDKNEVYGITGRIVRVKKPPGVVVAGEVKLGGSSHIARAIVAMMRHYPEIRSCMNIRYDPRIIEAIEGEFLVSYYDRREEPEEVKRVDGRTTQRGIDQAVRRGIEKYGKRPLDVVYHTGDRGKEPMILVFGRDPNDVYEKIRRILEILEDKNRFLDRFRALSRVYILTSAF